jgi:signal transduction histidine kinase
VRLLDLWKISRFRLTFFYGAIFSAGVMLLLGLIYYQTAGYMGRQMDQVIRAQARSLNQVSAEALPHRIQDEIQRDVRHINLYGLFSADGTFVVGNVRALPSDLKIDGAPRQVNGHDALPPGAHVLAERMPWGEILVVGRDATQLGQIREIILHALFWSGAVIVVLGLLVGAALSVQPLQHITAIQAASRRIMDGDLTARLPVAPNSGELDMLAGIVNAMLDEVQRLVGEVKSASDSLAHDLRTPLTRLRALLYRIEQDGGLPEPQGGMLAQAIGETDTLLGRFRALLRVSEIESRERRAGFAPVELGRIIQQIGELFEPVAADRGVDLRVSVDEPAMVQADGELIFEALSNLVDNAVKFTPVGGRVEVRLTHRPDGPRIEVCDTGPGVPSDERASVLRRFYRSARDQTQPGSGIGLSIVAAIVGLHDFALELEDAQPGLRIAINCWPRRMRADLPDQLAQA